MGNRNKWMATNFETKTNIDASLAATFDASWGGTITGNLEIDGSLFLPAQEKVTDVSTAHLVIGVTGDMEAVFTTGSV